MNKLLSFVLVLLAVSLAVFLGAPKAYADNDLGADFPLSGTSETLGDGITYYNFNDGTSGTAETLGDGITYYNFNNYNLDSSPRRNRRRSGGGSGYWAIGLSQGIDKFIKNRRYNEARQRRRAIEDEELAYIRMLRRREDLRYQQLIAEQNKKPPLIFLQPRFVFEDKPPTRVKGDLFDEFGVAAPDEVWADRYGK